MDYHFTETVVYNIDATEVRRNDAKQHKAAVADDDT
jgi:hypothetical protein